MFKDGFNLSRLVPHNIILILFSALLCPFHILTQSAGGRDPSRVLSRITGNINKGIQHQVFDLCYVTHHTLPYTLAGGFH